MSTGIQNNRIDEYLNLLFSEILLGQQEYSQLRQPHADKLELIPQKLKEYEEVRGRGFFFPLISSGKGHGPFSELIDGSVKYDLINSIGVNLLGHSHPLLIRACLEAATMDTIMVGNLHLYEDPINLSKAIVDSVSGSRLSHFWFAGSGSFANDNALKMIWQKSNGKTRVLALEKCFAGRSIATQDITHNADYKIGMPTSLAVDHFKINESHNLEEQIKKTLENLEILFTQHQDEYCCLMLELVQGEGGFNTYHKDLYVEIFKWARSKELFIWVDEIQSFGRTGQLFAFQTLELDEYPDIVTVGKALQVCGTLFSKELNPKPGLIAGTFQGSLSSIKASLKILKYLRMGNFFGPKGRISQIRSSFEEGLKKMALRRGDDFFHSPSGLGLMFAFQLKDGNKELTSNFIKTLFTNGIICFSCGKDPYKIRFLLPLSITDKHIEEIFSILDKTATELTEG
jgi:4-aminobutyrate aminotransferase-like enzyme